jgi:hypothetical protein
MPFPKTHNPNFPPRGGGGGTDLFTGFFPVGGGPGGSPDLFTGFFPAGQGALGAGPDLFTGFFPAGVDGSGTSGSGSPGNSSGLRGAVLEKPSIATINEVPLLGSKEIRWALREGVRPMEEIFHIDPKDLKSLEIGTECTLTISGPRGEIEFRKLVVIDHPPGPNPFIGAVRLADRRYFWPYRHVLRRFNMRRNVGTKRAPNPIAELQTLLPEIQYAPYSLKSATSFTRWTAEDVLKRVLKDVTAEDPIGEVASITLPGGILRGVPIEDLELDDRGDQAIARVLAYLPGIGIFVNPAGDIVAYNRCTIEERDIIRRAGNPVVGEGFTDLVDRAFLRPREIIVLFSYEVEVRFDFLEQSGATKVVRTEKEKEERRLLENVLSIPDFSLFVNSIPQAQGTWINFDQALDSWNALGVPGVGSLGYDFLLRAFMPFTELWGALLLTGQFDPNSDWGGRVAAMMQHFRRTFRLPQGWVDRTLSMRPYRISTIDTTTGSRGPATVYGDYAVVPSQRAFQTDRNLMRYIINFSGYPPGGVIGATSKPIPAGLSIVDSDQGILQVDYLSDPARVFQNFLPGKTTGSPTGDFYGAGREGTQVAFDAIPDGVRPFALLSNYKMIVILTLIPAAPNSKRQLFEVTVRPKDVVDLLPPNAVLSIINCKGPPMEVRVPASVETARVRWSDGSGQEINQLFGIGVDADDDRPPNVNVHELISNLDGTMSGPTTGASLEAVARAAAAKVWTDLADRFEGDATFDLAGTGKFDALRGSLEEIEFIFDVDGSVKVHLSMPEKPPQFSLFSFLDDGTRSIVMRLVQGGDA